jgi:hypothetical protein
VSEHNSDELAQNTPKHQIFLAVRMQFFVLLKYIFWKIEKYSVPCEGDFVTRT